MIPILFDEANLVLSKPETMTDEDCEPLCVALREDEIPTMTSCWKLTKEEVYDLLCTGRIWLTIAGTNHPPVSVSTIKPF